MKEVVTKKLLTFVLLVVLIWYTAVIPSYSAASMRRASDEGPPDAEDREVRLEEAGPFRLAAALKAAHNPRDYESFRVKEESTDDSLDDFDWPDIIDA